jgi:hypothetical protein
VKIGVCNVQKEIGVRMAYAFLTDSVKIEAVKQSIGAAVMRLLYKQRELLSEHIFRLTKQSMNSHYIIPFQNQLAPYIGLSTIPGFAFFFSLCSLLYFCLLFFADSSNFQLDPDTCSIQVTGKNFQDFFALYDAKYILTIVSNALNEKPRRLPYEELISWFQENYPSKYESSYEFLEDAFDANGLIKNFAIIHLLHKLKIIVPKNVKSLEEQLKEANVPVSQPGPVPLAPVIQNQRNDFGQLENVKALPDNLFAPPPQIRRKSSIGGFFAKFLPFAKKTS